MNSFISDMIKASIILAILYIPYFTIFKKYTFFKLNRFYLIGSVYIAFILPLIKLNVNTGKSIVKVQQILDPVMISSTAISNRDILNLTGTQIFKIIYLTGTFIFLMLLLLRFLKLFLLIRRNGITKKQFLKIVIIDGESAPASFFNFVFLSKNEKHEEILSHEEVHFKQGHSFDILVLELAKIVMWFNPFIWIYRTAICNIHEYLADENTLLKGYDRINYQTLIFENTFGVRLSKVAASFNDSPLKKRLKMMAKDKSNKRKRWSYIIILPLLAIAMLHFSVENSFGQEKKKIIEEKDQVTEPDTSDKDYLVVVDEMPVFKDQDPNEFRKFIAENLHYPETAMKKGIQGRVYVQFCISTQGDVVDAKVVRGVDPLLDQEALRVVTSSPKWIPGKQEGKPVKVQYTFPINFSLGKKTESK